MDNFANINMAKRLYMELETWRKIIKKKREKEKDEIIDTINVGNGERGCDEKKD